MTKDVGYLTDALSLIQNLTCAEAHIANCYSELKDDKLLEILTMVRRDRSVILDSITPENKSELYCFNKHMSTAIQNFKELANRMLEDGETDIAKEYLGKAKLYESLLIILNTQGGKK